MEAFDEKVYAALSKSECLDILTNFEINGLVLFRIRNVDTIPELLCRLTFFAEEVCPKGRGSVEGKMM